MMTWYDKLALAGIVVGLVGAVMFIVGFWFMVDARSQARAAYRASIEDAHRSLQSHR